MCVVVPCLCSFRYDIPLFLLYEPRTLVSDEKAAMMQPKVVARQLSADEQKRMVSDGSTRNYSSTSHVLRWDVHMDMGCVRQCDMAA